MLRPGSQQFWRPFPGCSAPFPPAASSPGGQRFGWPLPWRGAPFPSIGSGLMNMPKIIKGFEMGKNIMKYFFQLNAVLFLVCALELSDSIRVSIFQCP